MKIKYNSFIKNIILIVFILSCSTTSFVYGRNNNNNNNNKYHNDGKADEYSNSREDSDLNINEHAFNSFSTSKPTYPSLYEQISNRLYYHTEKFNEISNAVSQFGDFISSLKNMGNPTTSTTAKKSTNNNKNDKSEYTPTPLSSPSSLIAQQQARLLEKKQQKHGFQSNHQFKSILSNGGKLNGNDMVTSTPSSSNNNREFGKNLGELPIVDGLDEWFDQNKPEIKARKLKETSADRLIHGVNVASICNAGVLVASDVSANTCLGSKCYINEMQCQGENITITNTTPYNKSTNYDECQIFSIYCPKSEQVVKVFDFSQLYSLQQCNTRNFTCGKDQQFLSDCVINDIVCDGSTQFGVDMFAFQCTSQQLLCNSVIIPAGNFSQYNESISNGQCQIQTVPCSATTGVTYKLQFNNCTSPVTGGGGVNCTMTYTTSLAALSCQRKVPQQQCVCPMDYMGKLCSYNTPIACDLKMISPLPNCTTGATGDYLLSSTHCFTNVLSDSPIFKFNLECFFAVSNPQPSSPVVFKYWIDTPDLKITNPIQWSFSSEYINFYRLFNTSLRNDIILTKSQMSGAAPIYFNSTILSSIPSDYFIAKRVYTEISLITPTDGGNSGGNSGSSSDSGSSGSTTTLLSTVPTSTTTLTKFFIYVSDYPITSHPSPSISKVKLALIIVGSFLAFVLLIGAFIFYRYKLKVN